ncbi:MAG: AraC family transcriptional regulator [Spirochaetales bacterium]|nr:AraC family transcriptional regulator [Spirochaetales bacterium]
MDKTSDYIERINKVIDYIELNLTSDIQLDDLAQIACLSKFHFHRIFYSFTNESLYSFLIRLRTERSATLLLSQKKSITDIAFSCGFNDSATFSRAFKKQFGMSASEWKKKKNSKIHQDHKIKSSYIVGMNIEQNRFLEPLKVKEKYLNDMHIAYIRHIGFYAGDSKLFQSLYKKLIKWAEPAGVVNYPETKDVVIYHDSIGITENDKLRISVGITVPENTKVAGEIGSLCISKGRYISCRFEVYNNEYGSAWTQVFRNILPQRGLQPDDGYCFELYPPNCYNKEKKSTSALYVNIVEASTF